MTHVEDITKIVKLNLKLQCKSRLCDYSDAYIFVKWTISIAAQGGGNSNKGDKELVFKNYASFTDCMHKKNNTQIYNTKEIDAAMPMYNLIEYSDNCSKTSGSLRQYYRDEPPLTNAGISLNLHPANNSASFKFKQKAIDSTGDEGTKALKIMVLLK